MSVLTKVFVVLVTILSVALVAATVPFVANTTNYRELYDGEVSAKLIAQATAEQRQTQLNEERSERQAEFERLSSKIKDLERQAASLMATQAALRAQIMEKGIEIDKLRAQESQLTAANRNIAATAIAQATELKEHRSQMREHAERVVGLETRVAELDNDNQFLTQRLRFYQEQVEALQVGKEDLHSKIRMIPPNVRKTFIDPEDGSGVVVAPHAIEGQVVEVRKTGDTTWVRVNVGRSDGVQDRMQFFVQRGDEYIGMLAITLVNDRSAAGRMDLTSKGREVTAGDVVSVRATN